jgi:RNA polymerase sigma factor (sigma-70 family)
MQRIGSAPSGGEHARMRVDQRDAFAELADHHLDAAYRLAGVILGDPVEAQDATHDAVVVAWRRYGSLRNPDHFEAWFQRILINLCRDRLRRQRGWPVVEIDLTREPSVGHDGLAKRRGPRRAQQVRIDPLTGAFEETTWQTDSPPSWQRVAP